MLDKKRSYYKMNFEGVKNLNNKDIFNKKKQGPSQGANTNSKTPHYSGKCKKSYISITTDSTARLKHKMGLL